MDGHEEHTAGGPVGWDVAAQATLHCLTGCAIGEVLGMVIGTVARTAQRARPWCSRSRWRSSSATR